MARNIKHCCDTPHNAFAALGVGVAAATRQQTRASSCLRALAAFAHHQRAHLLYAWRKTSTRRSSRVATSCCCIIINVAYRAASHTSAPANNGACCAQLPSTTACAHNQISTSVAAAKIPLSSRGCSINAQRHRARAQINERNGDMRVFSSCLNITAGATRRALPYKPRALISSLRLAAPPGIHLYCNLYATS